MQDVVKLIKIETGGAITTVNDLKQHIKELQDALVNLDKDTEEYNQIVEEAVASQTKLNEVMATTKKNASAAEGSYNALVQQMSALKTVWRATTSEVQRAQLGEKIKAINDQLKEYDATIGNNQRKVGSYEEALQVLNTQFANQRQELTALKNALDNLEPGTDAYNEAFLRATEITHNLQERQQELRMSANDLGTQLGNVMSIGTGLVSGFNAINAIMALTGQKNEDLQKTMVKLQAGIALVQGAKGLEGAEKALKGYAKWAANAYDRIEDFISGKKKEAKAIQESTTATEKNTAANESNAVAEKSAASGANQLSAGMKSTSVSTNVATGSMVAFKAVMMTLGIGVVVAALSGLVTILGKLRSEFKLNGEIQKDTVSNYIDLLEQEDEKNQTIHQRKMDLMRAEGKSEKELFEAEMEHEQKIYDRYDAQAKVIPEITMALQNYRAEVEKAPLNIKGNELPAVFDEKRAIAALKKSNFSELLKKAGFNDEGVKKIMEQPIDYLEKRINDFAESSVVDMSKWTDEMKKSFKKIKDDGIESFDSLTSGLILFGDMMGMARDNFKFDPMEGTENEMKVRANEYLKTAEDEVETEIGLENKRYNAKKELMEKAGVDTTKLTQAHNKKVYEIITANTQSILDSAKAANQTELQNLEDKYNKELKILKQYGRDTTELTKAYEKQRAEIMFKEQVKAIELSIKDIQREASKGGELKKAYDILEAAGVAVAADLAKAQEESYEQTKKSLTQQANYWKEMWDKVKDDEKISLDERLEISERYLNAKKELEDNETKHMLDQIKTRKKALDEEIASIEKNYSSVSKMQSLNIESKYVQTFKNGNKAERFLDTFWGANQMPSYNQQRDDLNERFGIDRARLEEEIAAYQKFAQDRNATEAEVTAAKQKEAEKRMELSTLERENELENIRLQIEQEHELINTIVDVGSSIADILGTVADAWEENIQAQVEAGKMSQEEANKQLEAMRGLQIAQAVINTLSGSLGAFTQASATIPPPAGQIVGAAAAAAVAAAGAAQIAQIANANRNSTITSTMMAQSTPVMQDFQPAMTGTVTGTQEREDLVNAMQGMNLYVKVTDIDAAQEQGKVRVAESTF